MGIVFGPPGKKILLRINAACKCGSGLGLIQFGAAQAVVLAVTPVTSDNA
jgi:hypothetical protein